MNNNIISRTWDIGFEHEHSALKNKFGHFPNSSSKDCQIWQAFSNNNFANWNGSFTSKQGKKENFLINHTNQRLTQSIQVSTLPASKGIIKSVLRTSCLLSFALLPLLLSLLLFFALSTLPSPIFLRGARFDQLQDANERGADAKDPQIGCLVAWLLAGCTSHFLLSKFFFHASWVLTCCFKGEVWYWNCQISAAPCLSIVHVCLACKPHTHTDALHLDSPLACTLDSLQSVQSLS